MIDDQQVERVEPAFDDALFRQKRKKGKYRVIEAPALERPVADTHAHVHLLADPALTFARCAVHGVRFVCDIVDVFEDGSAPFDRMDAWCREAGSVARRLVGETGDGEGCESRDPSPTVPCGAPIVPRVRLAVGCHPHNAKHYDGVLEAELRRRLADPRVAAVGEIGLDYHYDFSPRDDQRAAFRRQVRLAKECGLPVILHVREAHDEALAIMRDEGFPEAGTLLHCFNLSWDVLAPWVEEGCFVAFGGPLTFKGADEVRDAATRVPIDHLLTETDAPYMTPEPLRGMICGSEHVVFTASRLAEVLGCESGSQRAVLLDQLMGNAKGLLDRPATAWQKAAAASLENQEPA